MEIGMFLSIILYILGIVLLVVLIVLGLRFIQTLDKVDRLIDDVQGKVDSMNGLFYVIDKTTSSIDLISNKVVNTISNSIGKIFKKRKKEKENDIYE